MIGTIGALAIDQALLRARVETASRQVSTGFKGTAHGDLGPEARRAIDLRAELARREAQAGAADRALARSSAMQGALGRLQGLLGEVAAEASRARTLGAAGAETLAITARAALAEAATLLNARHDGEYLFAGADSATPPVPAGDAIAAAPMGVAIAAAVATLDPFNAGAVLAATGLAATAPATTPFDAQLEGAGLTEAARAVQVGDAERVAFGVFANRDQAGEVALAWGREALRGLATLAALTPAQAAQGPGYDALLRGVADGLGAAARGVAAEQGAVGTAERRIEAARDRGRDLLVTLRAQLGAIEEVDLAEASAKLRAVQARLEASYQATSLVARLSLAALLR